MQYPSIWERLGAALVDWLLYTAVTFTFTLLWSTFASGNLALLRIVGFLAALFSVALIVAFKVLFEGGSLQATPGKLVFGLIVVDENGGRAPWMRILFRTWPWWIYLLTAITQILLLGFWVSAIIWFALLGLLFTMVMPPGGRCIHDITARLYVVKSAPGLIDFSPGR
jgi:uncharacterized RDD family membrane protein YckC